MNNKKDLHKKIKSRREAIKRIGVTSAFIVPTIATFNIKEVQAQCSLGMPEGPPECGP